VAGYLELRARSLLDGIATEILGKPEALANFLSGTPLCFADGEVRYWRDLSLPTDRVVDAFTTIPFGLYRLREGMSGDV
jgi:hypothetical protein